MVIFLLFLILFILFLRFPGEAAGAVFITGSIIGGLLMLAMYAILGLAFVGLLLFVVPQLLGT